MVEFDELIKLVNERKNTSINPEVLTDALDIAIQNNVSTGIIELLLAHEKVNKEQAFSLSVTHRNTMMLQKLIQLDYCNVKILVNEIFNNKIRIARCSFTDYHRQLLQLLPSISNMPLQLRIKQCLFEKRLTPLMIAVIFNDVDAISELINTQCILNVDGILGTALMLAVYVGNEQIVDQLIAANCDINKYNLEIGTALHIAFLVKEEAIVKKLLNAPALTVEGLNYQLILMYAQHTFNGTYLNLVERQQLTLVLKKQVVYLSLGYSNLISISNREKALPLYRALKRAFLKNSEAHISHDAFLNYKEENMESIQEVKNKIGDLPFIISADELDKTDESLIRSFENNQEIFDWTKTILVNAFKFNEDSLLQTALAMKNYRFANYLLQGIDEYMLCILESNFSHQKFCDAIANHDVEMVSIFLKYQVLVRTLENPKTNQAYVALEQAFIFAIKSNAPLEIIELFLQNKYFALENEIPTSVYDVLQNRLDIIEYLLEGKKIENNCNLINLLGIAEAPLCDFKLKIIRLLMTYMTDPQKKASAQYYLGFTPLMISIVTGDLMAVTQLLSIPATCRINEVARDNLTALWVAIILGESEIVTRLIKAGCDVYSPLKLADISNKPIFEEIRMAMFFQQVHHYFYESQTRNLHPLFDDWKVFLVALSMIEPSNQNKIQKKLDKFILSLESQMPSISKLNFFSKNKDKITEENNIISKILTIHRSLSLISPSYLPSLAENYIAFLEVNAVQDPYYRDLLFKIKTIKTDMIASKATKKLSIQETFHLHMQQKNYASALKLVRAHKNIVPELGYVIANKLFEKPSKSKDDIKNSQSTLILLLSLNDLAAFQELISASDPIELFSIIYEKTVNSFNREFKLKPEFQQARGTTQNRFIDALCHRTVFSLIHHTFLIKQSDLRSAHAQNLFCQLIRELAKPNNCSIATVTAILDSFETKNSQNKQSKQLLRSGIDTPFIAAIKCLRQLDDLTLNSIFDKYLDYLDALKANFSTLQPEQQVKIKAIVEWNTDSEPPLITKIKTIN